ncbi:hypothetical protein LZ318_36945 [Saccharopolyspora indica]|uniref:hypothetical protein n=1 Tax=Saccharopolyspora indica TaxID=1229659 RepID=UPI0022EB36FE|nr:hypothetical protein [Saccharopolyspora indica]MDA3647746.1 hypothetical protein [Saccharopolyspora indica]
MSKHPEEMTDAELADFHYAHRDDPEMDGEEVEFTITRPLTINGSLRSPLGDRTEAG